MAHVFPNSGLSALLGAFPRSAVIPGVLYVGLFGSQTSGTVPSRTAFNGAAPGGWVETVGMPRQVHSAGDWGAGAVDGNGYRITGKQMVFPTATAAGSANGFFLATNISAAAQDTGLAFANFDDLTTITFASGDVIRVTPYWAYNVSAGA